MAKTSRSEIVHAARELMRAKGYAATSMKDVADQVGLLKGSLYAHFDSKEKLVPEVLALALAETIGGVGSSSDWREGYSLALDRFVKALRADGRCVGLHLAYGLGAEASDARNAVIGFFHALREHFATLLAPGLGEKAARDLATETITLLEGATLWLAIDGDHEPIEKAKSTLLARIEAHHGEEPDAEVRRLLDRTVGDWRRASSTERDLAQRIVEAEADLLTVRAALAGQIEAESCFR